MINLPNPDEVHQRLKSLSFGSKNSKPRYDIEQLHRNAIANLEKNHVKAKEQLSILINSNIVGDGEPSANIQIGFSEVYQSITFSLLDQDELKTFVVRQATHYGVAVKWKSYGKKTYIPIRFKQNDETLFISSGIGEYLILDILNVSYIALQSDHNDRYITSSMIEAAFGKIIVYFQDNDDSAKSLGQRLKALFCESYFVVIDFETVRDCELPRGYDLRDFCNEIANQHGECARDVIYQMINREISDCSTNAV